MSPPSSTPVAPSKYLAAFDKTDELMVLQRDAAQTLNKMQLALFKEYMTPIAVLHGPAPEKRLKDLLTEIQEKKPYDLKAFLQKMKDGPFKRWDNQYPSPDWQLRTPGTELIRAQVNQMMLTLASLQENNDNTPPPVPIPDSM